VAAETHAETCGAARPSPRSFDLSDAVMNTVQIHHHQLAATPILDVGYSGGDRPRFFGRRRLVPAAVEGTDTQTGRERPHTPDSNVARGPLRGVAHVLSACMGAGALAIPEPPVCCDSCEARAEANSVTGSTSSLSQQACANRFEDEPCKRILAG